MKKFLFSVLVSFSLPFSSYIMATPCSDVETQIANKIINNGVPEDKFDLFSIDVDATIPEQGKIVGHCDGGHKQIVYRRYLTTSNKIKSSSKATENTRVLPDNHSPDETN